MATQRESLGFTTAQIDLNDGLIAGEKYRTEWSVVIAQGQPALKRGQILIGPETGAAPYVGAGTIMLDSRPQAVPHCERSESFRSESIDTRINHNAGSSLWSNPLRSIVCT
jgi:hypothetical protein